MLSVLSCKNLLQPVIAFAMALMLVFAATESFACALEDTHASGIEFSEVSDTPDHNDADGACMHGHCHHGAVTLPTLTSERLSRIEHLKLALAPHSLVLTERASTLERPPKYS